MRGAIINAPWLGGEIGGNLIIESLQDTSRFDGRQSHAGGAIAVGPGLVSGGASYSGSRATGDFASVSQPSGIYAGDGGYDLTVKGNTAFQGGVIASTQAAIDNDRNRLKTGTMTYGDIENYSHFNSSGIHLSGGYTSLHPAMGKPGGGAAAGVSQDSGRIHSTTQSSISPGTIHITNEAAQQALTGQTAAEAVAGINRDIRTEAKPQSLSKNWDGPRMLKEREAESSIAAMFGQQASQAAGVLADELAVKARMSADETTAKKWDEGGEYRVALHGGIGALTGGLAGATGAALSAAMTPMLGERIASMNLPTGVTEALNVVAATAIGAVANVQGATAALNQAANNYISRSPFPGVRRTTALENARLLKECGENCSQQDLIRIDRQVALVETAANLLEISKRSSLTLQQAERLTQGVIDLAPGYSNLESLAQIITGYSTLTGEEVSRLWAAIGVLPTGGVIKRVGNYSEKSITSILRKLESAHTVEIHSQKYLSLQHIKNLEEAARLGILQIEGKYTFSKPGPLNNIISASFSGGRYTAAITKKNIILYRAGSHDHPYGQFFSTEPPSGIVQTRIDKAILPVWPGGAESPIDTLFTIEIPAGTNIYFGKISSQGGFYVGGHPQIVIEKPWLIKGVRLIDSKPIK